MKFFHVSLQKLLTSLRWESWAHNPGSTVIRLGGLRFYGRWWNKVLSDSLGRAVCLSAQVRRVLSLWKCNHRDIVGFACKLTVSLSTRHYSLYTEGMMVCSHLSFAVIHRALPLGSAVLLGWTAIPQTHMGRHFPLSMSQWHSARLTDSRSYRWRSDIRTQAVKCGGE